MFYKSRTAKTGLHVMIIIIHVCRFKLNLTLSLYETFLYEKEFVHFLKSLACIIYNDV